MSEKVDARNAEIVPRGNYAEVIGKIVDAGNCPFCPEHLFEHHTKPILFQNGSWILTQNGWPYRGTQFHLLMIAKRHVGEMTDLYPHELLQFFDCISWFKKEHQAEGWALLWRSGATALTGASVGHLHAHIIVGQKRTEESESITALVGFRSK